MSLLDKIDEATGGDNQGQLELLIFRLNGPTLYGVNVFKTREILSTPPITKVIATDKKILGLLDLRGEILTAIDMALSLDMPAQNLTNKSTMLFMEFSNKKMCFVIEDVERIVYFNWSQVQLPPPVLSTDAYITAIVNFNGKLVQVIDIEKVLTDIMGDDIPVADYTQTTKDILKNKFVIGVDDSKVARTHLKKIFEKAGLKYKIVDTGKEAVKLLNDLAKAHHPKPLEQAVLAIVSDIEMPEMDGYTLVKTIKQIDTLKKVPIILNSSISESVGKNMAEKVGADDYLTKWLSNDLMDKLEKLAKKIN